MNLSNLTVVIPFFNGHDNIETLLSSLPKDLPVIVVDDMSDEPLQLNSSQFGNIRVLRLPKKGYFTGACNVGIAACDTDVLILNQDVHFTSEYPFAILMAEREEYAMIGEQIRGNHPAYPMGYIHGTFLFARRDAIRAVGLMDGVHYPLWGSTCEWQLRFCRKGYAVLPLEHVPGFEHHRPVGTPFGESIKLQLSREPEKAALFTQTPPLISMIIPCYNHGKYLSDLLASLLGGPSSMGELPGQTLQSFEVILVDDCSTDTSWLDMQGFADAWKGIKVVKREVNGGTPAAINTGAKLAYGRYIATMSADDMREPESLERLYNALQENPHSFAYDDAVIYNFGNRRQTWKMLDYSFDALVEQNFIHAGIMMPRSAFNEIGGYPEAMREGREDWAVNIALSLKGYCGVHVDYPGYIYRREGQNRTLQNTTPAWREKFKSQIQELFPEAFRPEVRMACCGKRTTKPPQPVSVMEAPSYAQSLLPMAGSEGMVVLEYAGGNFGTQTVYGPVTGQPYRYNAGAKKRLLVDRRDLITDHNNGLLQMGINGTALFKQLEPVPPPPPAPVEAPKEEVPVISTSTSKQEVGIDLTVLEQLAVLEVPRIGRTSAAKLEAAGITNARELFEADDAHIMTILGWNDERVLNLKNILTDMNHA